MIIFHPEVHVEPYISQKILLQKRAENKEIYLLLECKQYEPNYVEYIIGDICLKEAKNALTYDEKGFGKAFEVLGEVAMINLMEDPNVLKSLEEWVNYVSEDFIKKIN